MTKTRKARMSVADTAKDMIKRYGKSAARRASDREDKAQTEETAAFWLRVVDAIHDISGEKPTTGERTQP